MSKKRHVDILLTLRVTILYPFFSRIHTWLLKPSAFSPGGRGGGLRSILDRWQNTASPSLQPLPIVLNWISSPGDYSVLLISTFSVMDYCQHRQIIHHVTSLPCTLVLPERSCPETSPLFFGDQNLACIRNRLSADGMHAVFCCTFPACLSRTNSCIFLAPRDVVMHAFNLTSQILQLFCSIRHMVKQCLSNHCCSGHTWSFIMLWWTWIYTCSVVGAAWLQWYHCP